MLSLGAKAQLLVTAQLFKLTPRCPGGFKIPF
jgi:hypothetical protein